MSKKRARDVPERKRVVAEALLRDGGCVFDRARDDYKRASGLDISERALKALPERCAGTIDAHELVRRSQWKDGWLVLDNIKCLCRVHHDFVGAFPDDAHVLDLHRWSWQRPTTESETAA